LLEVVTLAEWKSGGDQRVFKLQAFGDAQAAVVKVGATAFARGKQVVAGGVVDNSLLNFALDRQRNADAIHRQAVDKVGGAVQWVDDPDELGIFGTVFTARFFGPDAVAGVGGQQCLNNHLFCGVVNLGYKVVDLLLGDANRLDVERGPVDDGTRSAGGLDGHVDHGMQIG
jgi:hypothetical protein